MRNETKVGVVVGLLVVVVASVYFYGSGRVEDEMFVVSSPKTAPVPQIPLSTDRKVALATPRSNPVASPAVVQAPPPAKPNIQPNTTGGAASTGSARPSFGGVAPVSNPPTVSPTIVANAANPRTSAAQQSAPPAAPIPLRTSASDFLTRATEANLATVNTDHTVRPASSHSADLNVIGDRIRHGTLSTSGIEPVTTPVSDGARTDPAPSPTERRVVKAAPESTGSWPKQHRIAAGDTFYSVAKTYYGNSSRYRDIVKANPTAKNSHGLKIGQMLIIPEPGKGDDAKGDGHSAATVAAVVKAVTGVGTGTGPAATKDSASPSGTRSYVVRDGDSFYTIAKSVYGDGRRWEEIFFMNKDVVKNSPRRLKPGMTITLPAAK